MDRAFGVAGGQRLGGALGAHVPGTLPPAGRTPAQPPRWQPPPAAVATAQHTANEMSQQGEAGAWQGWRATDGGCCGAPPARPPVHPAPPVPPSGWPAPPPARPPCYAPSSASAATPPAEQRACGQLQLRCQGAEFRQADKAAAEGVMERWLFCSTNLQGVAQVALRVRQQPRLLRCRGCLGLPHLRLRPLAKPQA